MQWTQDGHKTDKMDMMDTMAKMDKTDVGVVLGVFAVWQWLWK